MWVKLSPNRTDSCFPSLSPLKTHVKLFLNTVSLHWYKLKINYFTITCNRILTEEKKKQKNKKTKFDKTFLLKVQYPNWSWGQKVSVRITTIILHNSERVKFPTSFMNFIRVRVCVCTCRLTTSNLVAGVLDTCCTHNCPFSVHSLS